MDRKKRRKKERKKIEVLCLIFWSVRNSETLEVVITIKLGESFYKASFQVGMDLQIRVLSLPSPTCNQYF